MRKRLEQAAIEEEKKLEVQRIKFAKEKQAAFKKS